MDDEERAYLKRMAKAMIKYQHTPADIIDIGQNLRTFCPKEQPAFVYRLHRDLRGLDMTPEQFSAWLLKRAETP